MLQRSPHVPSAQPPPRARKIRPATVWATLTSAQRAAVLADVVVICQDCLLTHEEVSHDVPAPFAEDYTHPS